MSGAEASAGPAAPPARDPRWLGVTLRWGTAEIALQSNVAQVVRWTRDCFTAGRPSALASSGPAAAAVVVDDDLAHQMADCCQEPVQGTEMPAWQGEAEGMRLVRPVTEIISLRRPFARSWPDVVVFGLAPDGGWYAFTTSDPLGPRAGELLARQLLERSLREAGAAILHAAGAVLDGRALLFAGEAGGGKTTLATWAAARLGGYFLSGDKAAAYVAGGEAVAVGLAQPTRIGEGTLQSLLGPEWYQGKLPLPELNQMMGMPLSGKVAPGQFKVVLSNAELAVLGVTATSAAPLDGIVLLATAPAGAPVEVIRVPRDEALALVRPNLRSSWDLLPLPDGPAAERRHGTADSGLEQVLDRVPVLAVRWRAAEHDPAEVIAAIAAALA
jgi:hypothetical protein